MWAGNWCRINVALLNLHVNLLIFSNELCARHRSVRASIDLTVLSVFSQHF